MQQKQLKQQKAQKSNLNSLVNISKALMKIRAFFMIYFIVQAIFFGFFIQTELNCRIVI